MSRRMKSFIIPDIVLFVNGIPLCVVECKKSSEIIAAIGRGAMQGTLGAVN
jgi:type I site-specific restriction-modification system R (restriction) subunit